MPLDRTLLDLDRTPTTDELKDYFHKHDWSAAQISDSKKRTTEHKVEVNAVKEYLDPVFEQVSQEMGLKTKSGYLHEQDNPLMAMKDNVENLVSDGVVSIINEPGTTNAILEQYDLGDNEKADAFLHTAVKAMLTVIDYENLVKTIFAYSDDRDFSESESVNFRKMDNERRWNHTCAKTEVVFISDYSEFAAMPDPDSDVERIVIRQEIAKKFIDGLNDSDRRILELKAQGRTQSEIAYALRYANNSSVSKRLKKMKQELMKLLED